MKKSGLILLSVVCLITLFAQKKLYIFKSDKSILEATIAAIDSLKFSADQTLLDIHNTDQTITSVAVAGIDSITFADAVSDTITITYSGSSVSVDNPMAKYGISVLSTGADVVVKSTLQNNKVDYLVKGTTTDGSLKIYSDYKFDLILNNANITNNDGAAINIQSSKHIKVTLDAGTTNSLTDGSTYATSTEDEKSTFFSEGQLEFDGTGTLTVVSKAKHAICSDDYISITNGSITVSSAKKDGIHAKDYFKMSGGTLNITATGDAIESEGYMQISGGAITTTNTAVDVDGIKCDSTLSITGGTINMTVGGAMAKGIKSSDKMTLSGGTITVNTSGVAVLETSGLGTDPSYCTAIKSDSTITLNGANITITATGVGGKGISSNKDIYMTAGTVNVTTSGNGATYTNPLGITDGYAASCMDADGNISVIGGSLTATCSGTGSKGISADGNLTFGDVTNSPTVKVTSTGSRFLISGTTGYATANYAKPKCIKSDGVMIINNGTFTLSTANPGSSAFDSDSTLYFKGGNATITLGGNQSKGIKATRAMTLSGGTIIVNATGGVELETSGSGKDPAYCAAVKGDEDIAICGSNITLTSSGAAGKGVSGDKNIIMTSGVVKATMSGTGATFTNSSGTADSYSAAALSADVNLSILGGSVTTTSSGLGGKGLKADGIVTIGDTNNSPTLNITTTGTRFLVSGTDYCHPKTLVATGAITINNGTNTFTSSDDGIHSGTSITINGGNNNVTASSTTAGVGEGVESPLITCNSGTTTINASNDGINATYGTVSGGTESNDGSYFYMKGGIMVVNGSDAVDSNGNVVVSGGCLIVNGPSSGVEEGIDFNGTFNVNGGTIISCGSNSNMTKAMSTTSTQSGMYIKSSSLISSSSLLHIENASGTEMITFKPKNGGYYFHFSCPSLAKGTSYKIYTGGTYTGGSFVGGTSGYGMYAGGVYSTSGATLKSTTTLSSSSTVNTISF
ncbi:carbohydrate-binding domain-containing protein [Parabacteroides sp. FAFU027]|uniref:carbohydrate-binding domain-containing protein n=1 Tax=Parabacteroides sp. FAFU027 TaxID=2922715 RepID=UPI001FAFBDB4|nr:carbohydrate-binding domain-containing protein [Parabacteroides sp. FAFU027]